MARTLSQNESRVVLKLEYEGVKLVTVDDISKILGSSRNYARYVAHRLENKRWLERISRGRYIFIPAERGGNPVPPMNPLLAGSGLVKPYYYSYATATHFYGFTTQIPAVTYIAVLKAKKPLSWRNTVFRFVTLSADKFFGFGQVKAFDAEVIMAEKEKAVVDAVDKVRNAGGIEEVARVLYKASGDISMDKLVDYSLRMRSFSLNQRLGFLLDSFKIKIRREQRKRLLENIGTSPVYLDPARRWNVHGPFDKEWRIIPNVPEKSLTSEIDIG